MHFSEALRTGKVYVKPNSQFLKKYSENIDNKDPRGQDLIIKGEKKNKKPIQMVNPVSQKRGISSRHFPKKIDNPVDRDAHPEPAAFIVRNIPIVIENSVDCTNRGKRIKQFEVIQNYPVKTSSPKKKEFHYKTVDPNLYTVNLL